MSIDTILARRSIRKYTGRPVGDGEIGALLEAGMSAPSASNRKPWHFVVVRNPETLAGLADAHPHGKMLREAAAAIAVCGDTGISPDYWVQDCSASTENILLAVTALGLGAVWLGCHPRADRVAAVREILGIPEQIGILSLISIGHPAEEKEARTQYDEARVHRESW